MTFSATPSPDRSAPRLCCQVQSRSDSRRPDPIDPFASDTGPAAAPADFGRGRPGRWPHRTTSPASSRTSFLVLVDLVELGGHRMSARPTRVEALITAMVVWPRSFATGCCRASPSCWRWSRSLWLSSSGRHSCGPSRSRRRSPRKEPGRGCRRGGDHDTTPPRSPDAQRARRNPKMPDRRAGLLARAWCRLGSTCRPSFSRGCAILGRTATVRRPAGRMR